MFAAPTREMMIRKLVRAELGVNYDGNNVSRDELRRIVGLYATRQLKNGSWMAVRRDR